MLVGEDQMLAISEYKTNWPKVEGRSMISHTL